ncbi:conserved hypothetical protein [Cellulomonas flavigena DSM 20109]|uniref:Uncharacterized protein n=2 Tax=Cellulomonas flavigena TaxID=1711 RepID=D5UE32_CELFN|nr:conserved hypothetical protein [Cellulomonas flavigena DSM 20109]
MAKDPARLDDAGNWAGGSYELAVQLGTPDDARLEHAAGMLWRLAAVVSPSAAESALVEEPPPPSLDQGHTRGIVTLPGGHRVVCGAFAHRDDTGGDDWVVLYLPLGALSRADSRVGGYPFGDVRGSLTWRGPLDAWLASLADRLAEDVLFRVGLIGFDVFGDVEADDLAGSIPSDRWYGAVVPHETPRYYPATY